MGTWHSGEIIYAYGNVEASKQKHAYRYTDDDVALSKLMSSYWVNFVKTGNPNGPNLPAWDQEGVSSTKVMELGVNRSMIDDPFHKYYETLGKFENATKLK